MTFVRWWVARDPGGVLENRAEVEQRYDDEMRRRLAGSAWAGCVSWYKSAFGRISSNWPGLVSEYSGGRRRCRSLTSRPMRSREDWGRRGDTFLTSVQEVPTVVATPFLDNVQERWVR